MSSSESKINCKLIFIVLRPTTILRLLLFFLSDIKIGRYMNFKAELMGQFRDQLREIIEFLTLKKVLKCNFGYQVLVSPLANNFSMSCLEINDVVTSAHR